MNSDLYKIRPCFICKSKRRRNGEFWKLACPKHEAVSKICCTSVQDGKSSIADTTLDDLHLAFRYENGSRNPRRSLLDAIRKQMVRLLAVANDRAFKKGCGYHAIARDGRDDIPPPPKPIGQLCNRKYCAVVGCSRRARR